MEAISEATAVIIRRAIRTTGVSQAEIRRRTAFSKTTWAARWRGERPWSLAELHSLARALERPLVDLVQEALAEMPAPEGAQP